MTTTDPLRFDAATLALAWLSVAQASGSDANLPTLDRTVALELYPDGVRLLATDRYVLLTAWVPTVSARDEEAPHVSELPTRTVVTQDADRRGKGLLEYALKLTRLGKPGEEKFYGDLVVELDLDVRLPIEVGQDQLGGDDLDVAHGIYGTHGVDDVGILETAHDLNDGVDLADVGEELIAEALTL